MKKQHKAYIVAAVAGILVLGAAFGGILLAKEKESRKAEENVEYAMLKESPVLTEEEKAVKTQEYIEKSIEETLAGYEFESEEEENKYREILTEHFRE